MRYGLPVELVDGVHVALSPTAAPAASPGALRFAAPASPGATAVAPGEAGSHPLAEAPWRVREYEAVRALLRRLLTDVAGRDAGATPIAVRSSGQPFLPERPDLTVSLSHSGAWLAAAVGVGPDVGVDVQVPEPVPETLLRRCCGPATREALARLPRRERDREFAWIWTAQEACVKAIGLGLAGRPWTIPVDVGQRAGAWRDVRWLSLRDRFRVPVSCAYRPRGVAP